MTRTWTFPRDINTDQIVPGRHAPFMTSEAELATKAFIEARPEFAKSVRDGDIIIAGPNFGCGSSREYAARALRLNNLSAIIAPSFARIFFRNALNIGLRLFEADLQSIEDGSSVRFDSTLFQVIEENGRVHQLPEPPAFMQDIWQAGGIVPYYRNTGQFPGVA